MEVITTISDELEADDIPRWTNKGDGFNVQYNQVQEIPLQYLGPLGQGHGRSIVDKRESSILGRQVAVKTTNILSKDPRKTKMDITNEVIHLQSLKHYHIVRVIGSYYSEEEKWFSIILAPVADCDLRAYLNSPHDKDVQKMKERYAMTHEHLPRLMGCLAHTLAHVHKVETALSKEGVRHRDIKPSNILLLGRRIFLADFELSKRITETQTGSSGTSAKTQMYTSPERAANRYRNSSCDIFSLACVFAEMFTVYKGCTCEAFLDYRKEKDRKKGGKGDGYYYKVIDEVVQWLDELVEERCDVQIVRLLHMMLNLEPKARPSADAVWKTLTSCTRTVESSATSSKFFCGPCCMPRLSTDPLLRNNPSSDPSMAPYTSYVGGAEVFKIKKEDNGKVPEWQPFQTKVPQDKEIGLDWIRGVRHWDRSLVDVVSPHNYQHLLSRKRAVSDGNDEEFDLVWNEAQILKKVQHPHIVTLYNTYRQGNVFALLFDPATDFDLRSYLELAERGKGDTKFLTHSFGCLANALARLHQCGYDHGDIRRENILVHVEGGKHRIFLSKFSFGLNFKEEDRRQRQSFLRLVDVMNRLVLQRRKEDTASTIHKGHGAMPLNLSSAQYRPAEWKQTDRGQPAADIFSLGCVFIEMYTVLSGKRIRDFERFRIDELNRTEFLHTREKTLEWVSKLEETDYESKKKFVDCLRTMLDDDAERRPTALQVAKTMQVCVDRNGVARKGTCSIDPD